MNLAEIRMRIMGKLYVNRLIGRETELAARPGMVHAAADSPERFEIVLEGMKRDSSGPPAAGQAMRHMVGSVLGINRSLQTVDKNPAEARTQMPASELADLEKFAHSVGVDDMGYARLSETLVFQSKAVLHPNAIVLTMEMDKRCIDTSPSPESFVAVHETYHNLGDASNKIAEYLRKRGYSAHAGHPLGGLALYPPLAQQAIENLPCDPDKASEHQWIEDYCDLCRRCANECPPQAFLNQPLERDNGLIRCVETEKCFPYFFDHYGCSICIRVCPFQEHEYDKLRRHVVATST